MPVEYVPLDLDEQKLGAMLALDGPGSEQRLMRSLINDLRTARVALLCATERQDAALFRDQTHVLASLAGTFGGAALEAAARELEGRFRSEAPVPDCSRVLRQTDRLIVLLSARPAGRK